jgi:hypothetical protein
MHTYPNAGRHPSVFAWPTADWPVAGRRSTLSGESKERTPQPVAYARSSAAPAGPGSPLSAAPRASEESGAHSSGAAVRVEQTVWADPQHRHGPSLKLHVNVDDVTRLACVVLLAESAVSGLTLSDDLFLLPVQEARGPRRSNLGRPIS